MYICVCVHVVCVCVCDCGVCACGVCVCLQLEQEKAGLHEELASVKTALAGVEELKCEAEARCCVLQQSLAADTAILQEQVEEVRTPHLVCTRERLILALI